MAAGDLTATQATMGTKPCLVFDGTSNYAELAKQAIRWTSFTLSFNLYKHQETTVNDRFIDWQDAGPSNGFTILASSDGTKLGFVIRNSTTIVSNIISLNSLSIKTWYNIIVTYRENFAELFVNGTSQGSDTTCTMSEAASNVILLAKRIGGSNYPPYAISNFCIYNRVLDSNEIINAANGREQREKLKHKYDFKTNEDDTIGDKDLTLNGGYMTNTISNQIIANCQVTNLPAATDKLIIIMAANRDQACNVFGVVREA